MQVELDYTIRNDDNGIDRSFIDCYEIVDGLIYEAAGYNFYNLVCIFYLLLLNLRKRLL